VFVLLAIAITKKMKKLESYPQEKQRKQSKMFIMNNHFGGEIMREEYDIMSLNPKKNPHAKTNKKQVTINLDENVIEYFKNQSDAVGIPYQTLINLYLRDCMKNNRHPEVIWDQSVS
jgi:uncharacterized protein (DUF4415 family)